MDKQNEENNHDNCNNHDNILILMKMTLRVCITRERTAGQLNTSKSHG